LWSQNFEFHQKGLPQTLHRLASFVFLDELKGEEEGSWGRGESLEKRNFMA
jgi:hypothetical protein